MVGYFYFLFHIFQAVLVFCCKNVRCITKGLVAQLTSVSHFENKRNQKCMEVRQTHTASTVSQRNAYKLMLKGYPDVMNIEQMCEILHISKKTGYRILREGKVHSIKVGRAYRIPKAHLFSYLCIGCGGTENTQN